MIKITSLSLSTLLNKNEVFVEKYKRNPLMTLIKSELMKEKSKRDRLLDCLQVFSDYFQKIVMLRHVFCEQSKFLPITQQHLDEEYGHNISLHKDRLQRPIIWDPVLEATCCWFMWKMFTLDSEEKTLLIHLVLESSAKLFFKEAHKAMGQYNETQYFTIHNEADEQHEEMGILLLQGLTEEKYIRLEYIQSQAWDMLNTACERIASLTAKK